MSHSHYLQEIVKLVGHQSAIRLVRSKGGQCFGFPYSENLDDRNWLVLIIGIDNAKKLCDRFQCEKIKLPIEVNALIQLRNDAIIQDFKSGSSISSMAKKYEIDRKHVQNILDKYNMRGKSDGQEAQQLGLGV